MTLKPEEFNHATLPCGLRIVQEPSHSDSVYCGYVVLAGTRHEEPHDKGMAHFIEHMSFKGTEHRRACHISNGLERVGGELNAYTNKQATVYYATVLRPDFRRAAELLTDMVFHSTYPQAEITKEVEVICDEIESYKDSPAELIFDEFEAMVFEGQPLGRDILGEPSRLRSYATADARRFTQKYYKPSNAVFYIYGNVDFDRAVRTMELLTADFPPAEPQPLPPTQYALPETVPSSREVDKGTHQAHVLVGSIIAGGNDPNRFATMLLNNIVGGPGMSSRLNTSMREKAGLVYSIDSYVTAYPDVGTWNVYFGCDDHDVDRCLRILNRELSHFIDDLLTPTRLAAAKKQYVGQIGIARDNLEGHALGMGRAWALYGRHTTAADAVEAVNSITAEQIRSVAEKAFNRDRLFKLVYR